MDKQSDEIQNLRRCMRDLVALSTLPAVWLGSDPASIAASLADVLLHTLHLEFSYVKGQAGAVAFEIARVEPQPAMAVPAEVIGKALTPWVKLDGSLLDLTIPHPYQSGSVLIATTPIGPGAEFGTVVAGLRPSDLLTETDRLLLNVASNQAAIVLARWAAEEALREADRHKDRFLAMLAHELRNPLAPIRNALYVLKQLGPSEPPLVRAREIIDRQVTHQARLLDDLLDVSRITQGKIALRPERLDLTGLVRDSAEDSRSVLAEAGLSLSLELPEAPVWVEGDAIRLAQVVGNLLTNAAKFTDRGGQVSVELAPEPAGKRATLTVRDTGIGIEPEMLPRLFDTFSQAERSLERSRGGLGLGLALVKGLVELHGGEVRAASAGIGRGAEFTVLLPLTLPAAAREADLLPPPAAGPIRILIVEDNRDAADTLRDVLELSGCTVEVAYSGAEALATARQFQPEAVLCDLGLPGMNGCAVAAALRGDAVTATARLIAVSGYGQEEDQRRAREAGFDLHLTKPLDLEQLRRLLGCG